MYTRDDIKIGNIREVAKKLMDERDVLIISIAENLRSECIKKNHFLPFSILLNFSAFCGVFYLTSSLYWSDARGDYNFRLVIAIIK